MEISDLPEGLPFDLLRRVIAHECCDNAKNIKLYYKESVIKSGITPRRLFKDLSVIPDIECRFKHPSKTTKIHLGRRLCKLSRTDNITVYIHKGTERTKDKQPDNLDVSVSGPISEPSPFVVRIEWIKDEPKKPFLGGYRRKTDMTIFHHASSQTMPKPPKIPSVPITSRDTQTYAVRHEGQDTVKDASTAMSKPGFFVTNISDRVITPRPYETAAEYEERRNRNAIIIQKWVRRWLARRKVGRLRSLLQEYEKFVAAKEQKYIQDKIDRADRDYERRANPKNRYDIDRLFNALEEWRLSALADVYSNSKTLVVKKAKMNAVLDKEIEFIRNIIQKQIALSNHGKMREQELTIEKAARPFGWKAGKNSKEIEVDTPDTLKAKNLLILYENLKTDGLTKTERMDLLLTVKKIAGAHPSQVSCDLVALAERETELMLRDIPSRMLVGLRQRILQSFIQFLKKPEVNPAVAEFIPLPSRKDPNARTRMWNDIRRCISCGRYLRTRKFEISARAEHLEICMFCWRQGNRGRDRLDLDPYRLILKDLRNSEAELLLKMQSAKAAEIREQELIALDEAVEEQKRRREAHDSTPVEISMLFDAERERSENKIENMTDHLELLVNVQDIYYLVNKVWDGRSALSGCSELGELKLCRWKISQPWSPWNTILLTKKEADLHMQLNVLPSKSLYADTILTHVRQRLVIGKNSFRRLCRIGKCLKVEVKPTEDCVDEKPHKSSQMKRLQTTNKVMPRYLLTVEERHMPTKQPPDSALPIIRGEKRMSDYGISSLKEVWDTPKDFAQENIS
ncbi:hypothetical protein Aperf_G00000031058 [Anoplocephala perfoliata]